MWSWLAKVVTGARRMNQETPRENGHRQSSNGKLRDECWSEEAFYPLTAARQIVETWRGESNESRPHKTPGKKTPNEFVNEVAAGYGLIAWQSAANSP
jgi:putative transposase